MGAKNQKPVPIILSLCFYFVMRYRKMKNEFSSKIAKRSLNLRKYRYTKGFRKGPVFQTGP